MLTCYRAKAKDTNYDRFAHGVGMVAAFKEREVAAVVASAQRKTVVQAKSRKHGYPTGDRNRHFLVLPLPRCDRKVPVAKLNVFKKRLETLFCQRFENSRISLEELHVLQTSLAAALGSVDLEPIESTRPVVGVPAKTFSKARQETIGVYSSTNSLTDFAGRRELTCAIAARSACLAGLEELEERLWKESQATVIEEFRQTASAMRAGMDKKQWSLRLDRPIFLRVIAIANEVRTSRSELALMCIAKGMQSLEERARDHRV